MLNGISAISADLASFRRFEVFAPPPPSIRNQRFCHPRVFEGNFDFRDFFSREENDGNGKMDNYMTLNSLND